ASDDGTMRVWDTASNPEALPLKDPSTASYGSVYGVAFSPDGRRLATSELANPVKVWDAASGQVVLRLEGHPSGALAVAFSPDGTRLATASWDGTVKVWDAATGEVALTLKDHFGAFGDSVAFSPDGKRIASGGRDLTVKVWDAASGAVVLALKGHAGM